MGLPGGAEAISANAIAVHLYDYDSLEAAQVLEERWRSAGGDAAGDPRHLYHAAVIRLGRDQDDGIEFCEKWTRECASGSASGRMLAKVLNGAMFNRRRYDGEIATDGVDVDAMDSNTLAESGQAIRTHAMQPVSRLSEHVRTTATALRSACHAYLFGDGEVATEFPVVNANDLVRSARPLDADLARAIIDFQRATVDGVSESACQDFLLAAMKSHPISPPVTS